MEFRPISHQAPPPNTALPYAAGRDLIAACLLAVILSACWTLTDWAQVGSLNLPDTDDMMRLAQVRDWIGGQGFADWTQYRLAPPEGAPMHWSRIADVGPAALITLVTPIAGRDAAELVAVIGWPALLFASSLFLAARIGRRLWGAPAAFPALVLTALAYPGNALFLPGRIDHHGLQVVVIQIALLALLRPATRRSGAMAGVAVAVSLGIGLETIPQLVVLAAVPALAWAFSLPGARDRLLGFALGMGGATGALLAFTRPTYWPDGLCDTFTPASSTATLGGAAVLVMLGLIGNGLGGWKSRLAAASLGGAAVIGLTLAMWPACVTGPYGQMSPFLHDAIIGNIVEANSVLAMPGWADMLSVVGVLVIACTIAAVRIARAPRDPDLLTLGALLFVSLFVTMAQVRGAYMGAALAGPMLAWLVVSARGARTARSLLVVGAWIVCAGMTWLELPRRIEAAMPQHASAPPRGAAAVAAYRGQCRSSDALRRIAAFPAGTVMAPIDLGAYVIGATPHGSVAAGYHRNNRGNAAMYRFFLSDDREARAIATMWNVAFVVTCPGDFSELGAPAQRPGALIARLDRGDPPIWLTHVPLRDSGLRFYRVVR